MGEDTTSARKLHGPPLRALASTRFWNRPSVARSLALPVFLIGLAAALRLHNLTWNSLDNDEAFSWVIAHRPLPELVADSLALRGDPHPPVYWATLKAWMTLGGDSELSMRLLSVLSGVIYVTLVFELGRRLFSRAAGLGATLFAALGPFLIWNSQDARKYTFGATLALAGVVCLVHGLLHGSWQWWAGYFSFTALACYSHLAASFLLPFEGLLIVASAVRYRRTGRRGLLTLAAIGLVYLPYALNAWRSSGGSSLPIRYSVTYGQLLHTVTAMLGAYQGPLGYREQTTVVLFIGGVFALGVLAGREAHKAQRGLARLLTALYYLVPLAVVYGLSLRQPVFQPKSVTFVGAGLAVGVGAGWARLWQWRRAAGVILGLGLIGVPLYGDAFLWRLGTQKEDWRHAAEYVAEHAGPNDVVLIHLEYYRVVFTYYFHNAIPVIAPFGSHLPDQAEIDATLDEFAGYASIWLVQSGEFLTDPDHLVQTRLATRYPLATEQFPFSISVRQYVTHPPVDALPASATPVDAAFGEHVRLAAYEIDAQQLKATDDWLHPPSSWIHLRLYWSVSSPLAFEPVVHATLEDEVGNIRGGNMQRAGEMRQFFPMTTWSLGQLMRDDLDLNLDPAAPPGVYKIVVRLLAPDGTALPVQAPGAGADYLILRRVEIVR